MTIRDNPSKPRPLLLLLTIVFAAAGRGAANDWTDWRGPSRDGISAEKGLPSSWSPAGENLAWKAPYGGRSTPIVLGDRLYLQNSVGRGETLQERVVCLNADTGALLWEHRFNVFLSDVPPHRIGWASPVADPATGNVYVFGVGGTLLGLSRDGKVIWERSLEEEFGLITTHGGRTVSPVIEADTVIVSGLTSGWGNQSRSAHRFMAFDKASGYTVWVSSPGGRPYDTTYSPPLGVVIGGMRLLIAGASDGAMHALKALTGEPVWKFEMSKRGINTGAVVSGSTVYVSHSEENLESSEMGLLAAIDGNSRGDIGKAQIRWSHPGIQVGYSSPVLDGERLYQIDNGSNLLAFDRESGRQLWTLNLGTIQKASPVLADGKLYVGTENGKFLILKPEPDRCEVLDEDQLGTEAAPEAIVASAAVSGGRIYLVTSDALYCIGKKSGAAPARPAPPEPSPAGPVAQLQVVPTELVLSPGESVRFRARLFDERGRLAGEGQASWSLEQLQGTIKETGEFTAASGPAQAGQVKATVGSLLGVARLRVVPPLPWSENFEGLAPDSVPRHWINATGKFVVRVVGGNKVLVKLSDNPLTKRARVFMGPIDLANYTVQADVRATEVRRQLGDAGVVAQRYQLTLFGNHQRLELQAWQPETERTAKTSFSWKPDTWYRLKLQVENLPDGKVRARGKAWPAAEAEPHDWTLERIDPIPNRQGSPGIYADAPFEVSFDNLKVTANR
jgi:outer membrane protein assembly factor BamB